MKRVYLDQNKWVELARQVHGQAEERLVGPTLVLQAGVRSGEISLPLSSAHYMETQHRRDWRSRQELAKTMIAFSQLHTIAPNQSLLPGEVDAALQVIVDHRIEVREVRPFGWGAAHAFGMTIGPYRVPEELKSQVSDVRGFERRANRYLEQGLLIGPSPEEEAELKGYDPFAHLAVGERYAIAKEKLRELRATDGWHKGERGERVAMADALTDHMPVIKEALERAGIAEGYFMSGGKTGLEAFVEAVPTMHATSELERQRNAASQKPWEPHDLNDIGALSVAIAHCDIVVTERLWADSARRSKLDRRLGTVVLSDLEELTEHLVALD